MNIRDIARISLFVSLIAICSWISIPAAVPFTLQTFAVFLAIGVLGAKHGALAIFTYILLGAIGVPVFSQFNAGIGYLLGSTGGYIVGFLAAAAVIPIVRRALGGGAIAWYAAMACGLLALYAFGTAWFMFVYARANGAITLMAALSWCVIPFIIPGLLKLALAAALTNRLKAIMRL